MKSSAGLTIDVATQELLKGLSVTNYIEQANRTRSGGMYSRMNEEHGISEPIWVQIPFYYIYFFKINFCPFFFKAENLNEVITLHKNESLLLLFKIG